MYKAFFVISVIGIITGLTYLLSKRNGSDIRVVWYLSSLTVMISLIVTGAAISSGAIKGEEFVGENGELLQRFIKFMLDLEKDFLIVAVIASLVLVPQFVCYLLSGLSGNAKSPRLMGMMLSFFVWGIVKSLIVGASILLSLWSLYLFGFLPKSDPNQNAWFFAETGLYFLLLAFSVVSLFRESEEIAIWAAEKMPILKDVHAWFTRKEKAAESVEGVTAVEVLELSKSLMSITSEVQRIVLKYENSANSSKQSSDT